MLTSEKITICVAIWMMFILLITGDVELEIFFILMLIGFIIIKEFTDRFITTRLKYKMNIFIFVFIIIFVVFIGKKIINYLSI